MNVFTSKAIYSWKVRSVEQGNAEPFAAKLKDAGFQTVFLKVADGDDISLAWKAGPENVTQQVITALRNKNIGIIGWGFLNDEDAQGEGRVAAEQVNRFGLDGYIFDVETKFDAQPAAVAKAQTAFAAYRNLCDKPTGLAWWARWKNPKDGAAWHPKAVGKAWMDMCDYGLPMSYWEGFYKPEATPQEKMKKRGEILTNALSLLEQTLSQWAELTTKPIIPTGRAYIGDGGIPTPEAMLAFEKRARELGCKGVSWWGLDWAAKEPEWWQTLKSVPEFVQAEEPAGPVVVVGGEEEPEKPVLDVPYVSQLGEGADLSNRDCGFASAAMLIAAYTGVQVTPNGLHITAEIQGDPYIEVKTLKQVLNYHGVGTQWKAYTTLNELLENLDHGKPVMVLLKYKVLKDAGLTEKKDFNGPHFAVAVGKDADNVYINDPYWTTDAGAGVAIPTNTFLQAWNAVGNDPAVPNPSRAMLIPRLALGDPVPQGNIFKVTTKLLNVRSEPNSSSSKNVVDGLIKGTKVTVVEEREGWARTVWPAEGWVYQAYIEEVE